MHHHPPNHLPPATAGAFHPSHHLPLLRPPPGHPLAQHHPHHHPPPPSPLDQPMSRTYQYRKVMKPLLERKRRARINRCLDELKELMVGASQTPDTSPDNVSKLEKADVLELTVTHLRRLKDMDQLKGSDETSGASGSSSTLAEEAQRFKEGFRKCAAEVSQFLQTEREAQANHHVSIRLLSHLQDCARTMESILDQKPPSSPPVAQPPPVSSPNAPRLPWPSPWKEDEGQQPLCLKVKKTDDDPGPAHTRGSSDEGEDGMWRPW
ncbi:unnamed protein product [Cyprideis torosa]|uniref:Uncharacterized protein n=1 Tax=Cyprideis torosa TaxID=163714 RepID=A0A7R8W1F8_9CRUS|nr:unnamed protein product [Cyprideis torosa]CAG0880859.1 unnamed protein product [Cyprideis torosa]